MTKCRSTDSLLLWAFEEFSSLIFPESWPATCCSWSFAALRWSSWTFNSGPWWFCLVQIIRDDPSDFSRVWPPFQTWFVCPSIQQLPPYDASSALWQSTCASLKLTTTFHSYFLLPYFAHWLKYLLSFGSRRYLVCAYLGISLWQSAVFARTLSSLVLSGQS